MLTIRDAQMQLFERLAAERFPEELAFYIARTQPALTQHLSASELLRRVQWGIAAARTFGFTDHNATAAFVSLLFVTGPRFPRHPSFALLLNDTAVASFERLSRLFEIPAWSWLAVHDPSDAAWQIALRS